MAKHHLCNLLPQPHLFPDPAPRRSPIYLQSVSTLAYLTITLAYALVIGIVAFCVEAVTSTFSEFHHDQGRDLLVSHGPLVSWAFFVLVPAALVIIAPVVIILFSPMSAGAGITETIAYLNGIRVPKALAIKTVIVKMVAVMASVASNLCAGMEGPVVHFGATVAVGFANLANNVNLKKKEKQLTEAHSQAMSNVMSVTRRLVSSRLQGDSENSQGSENNAEDAQFPSFAQNTENIENTENTENTSFSQAWDLEQEGSRTDYHPLLNPWSSFSTDHVHPTSVFSLIWWRVLYDDVVAYLCMFHNDRDRRDLGSAGAAAGISAAFGAPIGGILFAMEEAATTWSKITTWRAFSGCMVAGYAAGVLRSVLHSKKEGYSPSVYVPEFGLLHDFAEFHVIEVFLFLLLGVVCGVLGGWYIWLHRKMNRGRAMIRKALQSKYMRVGKFLPVVEVVLAVMLINTVFMMLPLMGECVLVEKSVFESSGAGTSVFWTCDQGDNGTAIQNANQTNANTNQTNANTNQTNANTNETIEYVAVNTMAMLSFQPRGMVFKSALFSNESDFQIPVSVLFVYAICYYAFFLITNGLVVANGVFAPSLLLGGVIGRIFGEIVAWAAPSGATISPGIYSVVGAACFLGGLSRLTISLVAIVLEMSSSAVLMIPLMVGVYATKRSADRVSEPIYHALCHDKGYPLVETDPYDYLMTQEAVNNILSVAFIMSSPVIGIRQHATKREIVQLLTTTKHNMFAVFEDGSGRGASSLSVSSMNVPNGERVDLDSEHPWVGAIARSHLLALLYVYTDNVTMDATFMKLVNEVALIYAKGTVKVDRSKIIPSSDRIPLSPFLNSSVVTVESTMPLVVAYRMFMSVGLRQMFVKEKREVIGVITRSNFDHHLFQELLHKAKLD